MFDSNGKYMLNDLEFFDTYVEKIPIGIKRKSIFYELPYWEHINISDLVYPMHIFKHVSCSLWHHISSKKNHKLDVMLVPPFHLKKLMFHRFWINMVLIWKIKLYSVRRCLIIMGLLYDDTSLQTKSCRVWNHMTISTL